MIGTRHVVIVGGGVIGISCAYYLSKAGFRVTVIDRGKIGAGCSHGNCGFICPSHVLPLAEPGAIRSGLKAMLARNGPFRIKPRMNLALWRWLLKFAQRCNRRDMLESGRAIQPLLTSSFKLYEELVSVEGLGCEWQKQGLLFVYKHRRPFKRFEPVRELLANDFNESAQRIDANGLVEFEPALKNGLAGGWYFEHDAHLRPDQLLSAWRRLLENRGVGFLEHHELQQLVNHANTVTAIKASDATIAADFVVIATGARTPLLEDLLRVRIPIQPGKGYSITLPRPEICPRIPMIFPEHRVAVTPWENGMRLGSIMEFAGYDSGIRQERLQLLTAGAANYLRTPIHESWPNPWYGWRPMTYDSTPVIGRCPGFSNVYLATGHNMLGLSMAPATGRLVSEIIAESEPHIAAEPYAPLRFTT